MARSEQCSECDTESSQLQQDAVEFGEHAEENSKKTDFTRVWDVASKDWRLQRTIKLTKHNTV